MYDFVPTRCSTTLPNIQIARAEKSIPQISGFTRKYVKGCHGIKFLGKTVR
jgi:hypothetical protein